MLFKCTISFGSTFISCEKCVLMIRSNTPFFPVIYIIYKKVCVSEADVTKAQKVHFRNLNYAANNNNKIADILMLN